METLTQTAGHKIRSFHEMLPKRKRKPKKVVEHGQLHVIIPLRPVSKLVKSSPLGPPINRIAKCCYLLIFLFRLWSLGPFIRQLQVSLHTHTHTCLIGFPFSQARASTEPESNTTEAIATGLFAYCRSPTGRSRQKQFCCLSIHFGQKASREKKQENTGSGSCV